MVWLVWCLQNESWNLDRLESSRYIYQLSERNLSNDCKISPDSAILVVTFTTGEVDLTEIDAAPSYHPQLHWNFVGVFSSVAAT